MRQRKDSPDRTAPIAGFGAEPRGEVAQPELHIRAAWPAVGAIILRHRRRLRRNAAARHRRRERATSRNVQGC